ncbi:MAG: phosphoribosyltransferase family protein [Terriglobales bacterium]
MVFHDRQDAGRRLARRLASYSQGPPGVVLAIPRGGVIVAAEVAAALGWPLDVVILRKLGAPGQEELAFGAVAASGPPVLDDEILRVYHLSQAMVDRAVEQARAEVRRREELYRRGRPPLDVAGKRVIIVDDGVATGADMRAAVRLLRTCAAEELIVAVPVAPPGADAARFGADAMECLSTPADFFGVGQAYLDFRQVSDDAVIAALRQTPAPKSARSAASSREVLIPAGKVTLPGELRMPEAPHGLVLFAHGSGSSRHSPRNRQLAARLDAAGLATLLFDLLSPVEDARDRITAELRFNIPLLAGRLGLATAWAERQPELEGLDFGYFGASTGAAAALVAAAGRPRVTAVVSRGGRPDLAGAALAAVHAATLLIVGSLDTPVIAMNQEALARLAAPIKAIEIVPGASHLFEEPGALDAVARLASTWFTRHLRSHARAA